VDRKADLDDIEKPTFLPLPGLEPSPWPVAVPSMRTVLSAYSKEYGSSRVEAVNDTSTAAIRVVEGDVKGTWSRRIRLGHPVTGGTWSSRLTALLLH
jgi:hypothetical protein